MDIKDIEKGCGRTMNQGDNVMLGGSMGRQGCASPRGPNFFIFMQFLAKILRINRLAHTLSELTSLSGNPGSATG